MEVQAKKIVTKIEANPLLSKHNDENALLRVAAYCRVPTATIRLKATKHRLRIIRKR